MRRTIWSFSVILSCAFTLPSFGADDSSGVVSAQRALGRAQKALKAVSADPEVEALGKKNSALREHLREIDIQLRAADREITDEVKLAAKGAAQDAAFHAAALSKELQRFDSLQRSRVDLDRLLAIDGQAYKKQLRIWEESNNETKRQIDQNIEGYRTKIDLFVAYCPSYCADAQKTLEQANGNTEEGCKIVTLFTRHYQGVFQKKGRLDREVIRADFTKAFVKSGDPSTSSADFRRCEQISQ